MNNKIEVIISTMCNDGRWEDQEWIEQQADLSACENMLDVSNESWKNTIRVCVECGCEFDPKISNSAFYCSDECYQMNEL